MAQFPGINPRLPTLWHGGDYNPDQWPDDLRREDVRLMRLAHANVMSVAVFSWAQIEPKPGTYDWNWLDETFERLHAAGACVALATPSAAPPRRLTAAHPEILRVNDHGVRVHHGSRQRFCPSSPLYREHVARINRALAERYGDHPALVLWHVSNEYGGTVCFCERCVERFRAFLRRRYGDLETLNREWWARFWSQTFTDWAQIQPPWADCGPMPTTAGLDWKRYVTHEVCDFFKAEVDVLRERTPDVPVTNNLMGWFGGLDYAPFADVMDVISWDSYPDVGGDPAHTAATHAMMRGLKGRRPWLLMEQTPSSTNWKEFHRLQPPGLLRLTSWQAIAHGSDAAMYFQWRRSRGGNEKFHGAVVAHRGDETPRVFREVAALGEEMDRIGPKIAGTRPIRARAALLWDQENRWALQGSVGPGRNKRVIETLVKHYRALWQRGIAVDVARRDADWTPYDLLIAPQMYMVRQGRFPLDGTPDELARRLDEGAKIEDFVRAGGTFVATYLSGLVNESDLVYEGGWPGPLSQVLGLWSEEIDHRPDGEAPNRIVMAERGPDGMRPQYACDGYFELIHAESARVLAAYGANWYAGRPCLTENPFGEGRAYFVASDPENAFLEDFYAALATAKGIEPAVPPTDQVEILEREGHRRRILFLLNHAPAPRTVDLADSIGTDLLTGARLTGHIELEGHGVRVIERPPKA